MNEKGAIVFADAATAKEATRFVAETGEPARRLRAAVLSPTVDALAVALDRREAEVQVYGHEKRRLVSVVRWRAGEGAL